jgi:hypothetical protein
MRKQVAGLWVRALPMALAVMTLSAGAARAGLEVKDLQEDKKFNILECEFPYCAVVLQFKILNNNTDDSTYKLIKYGGFLKTMRGDDLLDVVAESNEAFTPDCSGDITPTSNCVVTLNLLVEDKNPSDDKQSDLQAKFPDSTFFWGVKVDEYLKDGVEMTDGPRNRHPVSVLDDVPEPSTWLLLNLGFAVTGAVLRRGRRRPLFH